MRGVLLIWLAITRVALAESDLPPVGRSMFDYLVHQNGGRLPHSVQDLVATMERLGGGRVATVMQPDSRSSQRGLADDAHPRILGVGDKPRASKRARTFEALALRPQTERIFFAYSERARTLEVLSYNPKAARNEFQFIRHFGSPEARLFYVRRSLCITCHLDGQPIFSKFPWSDTDQVDAVKERIRHAVGGARYQGIYIGQAAGFAFTEQVQQAARIQPFLDAWRDGMGNAPKAGREFLLATVLGATPSTTDGDRWTLPPTVYAPLPLFPDHPAEPRPPEATAPLLHRDFKPRPFLLRHRTPIAPGGRYAMEILAAGARASLSPEFRRTLLPFIHVDGRELAAHPLLAPFAESMNAPDPYALYRALFRRFRPELALETVLTDADSQLPPMVLADDGADEARRCPEQLAASAP